ncbi:MAG: hypothetical protein U1E73_07975 [Planctomycetota bacterium]
MAGYGFVWSLRRPAVRTDARAAAMDMPTIAAPTPPTAPQADRRAFAVPATTSRADRDAGIAVEIRLQAPPSALPNGGVALTSANGTDSTWIPFASLPADDGGTVRFAWAGERAGGTVAIAASEAEARHAYLARFRHDSGSTMQIDFAAHTVALQSPATRGFVGPLRLVRTDDPGWLPLGLAAAGLFVDTETRLLLGAGDYELVDPIDDTQRQRFSVPATEPIRLIPGFAPPAAPRR